MSGDVAASAIYGLLMIVLIASGFAARRLPWGQTAKMAFGWLAIFGLGFVVLSFRHDISALFGSRVLGRAVVEGGTVRVPMSDDGHFWVDATINGNPARLMVDSGATVTTLSQETATRVGIDWSDALTTTVFTANGPMAVKRARAASLRIGNITTEDLAVHVAPGDDINVVGMNFLSRLSRWSVEGRWLILTT